ncbi:MAG: M48 family metalloprotease [Cyanobacteria bacterium P01_F01_bin.150]
MNPTPGPSGPASNLKAQAKEAVTALKNEDYGEAIALLEPLLEQATKPSTEVYLRRNLAKAYMGLDNALAAFHQCNHLRRNPDPEVRKWAKKAINHLRKKYPYIENSATPIPDGGTGFVPLGEGVGALGLEKQGSGGAEEQGSGGGSSIQSSKASTPQHFNSQTLQNPKSKIQDQPTPSPSQEGDRSLPSPPTPRLFNSPTPQLSNSPTPQNPKSKIQNPKSSVFPWKNADRAKSWSPIRAKSTFASRINTILVHGWTAIALWIVAKSFLQIGMALGNPLRENMQRFMRFERWYFLEQYPGRVAAMVLVGLLLLSPWILDLFLKWGHRAKRVSIDDLAQHSPEAKKVLQQSSRKQNHPVPGLRLLPTQTPVILSYGLRPRFSRIVVSEGLLRQLDDEEIATLIAIELAHIRGWNLALVTLVTLSAQISYGLCQLFAGWADGLGNAFLQQVGAAFAAIAYGMFWLVRGTGLWLSRSRFEHSDRAAVNSTGNPNALTRALMKLAIATATDIRRQGHTAPLLEQFEWLMPVGYRSAISIGTIFPLQYQASQLKEEGVLKAEGRRQKAEEPTPSPSQEGDRTSSNSPTPQLSNSPTPQLLNSPTLLTWDYQNPHRSWLSINNTHPPLGDRLYRIAQHAKRWKLESELDLPVASRLSPSPKMKIQVAPFVGFFVGAALTLILWFVGVLADQFDWRAIEWLQYDSQSIFRGMLALSFSFGIILRFNDFFPDIKPSTQRQEELTELLTPPDHVPADSQPVQLEGKLLGRRGTDNWLNQDLILQTQTGLVRLHCISILGAVGNLIFDAIRLQSLKGRTVIVTGWLRRGATPWVDVDKIKSQQGRTIQAGHPIWSMLLATIAAIWGAYVLY